MKGVLPKGKNFLQFSITNFLKCLCSAKKEKGKKERKKEKRFPCVNVESGLYLAHISGSTLIAVYFKFKNYRLKK